ncbi:MAG: hypothetical protein AABW79_00085 [Nanoarchaeota archaeon]
MLKHSSTMRLNRRYLFVKASEKQVKEAIIDYIGLLGWANASPIFVAHEKGLIVGIDRKSLVNVRAAFALSAHDIVVLGVSGTLKGVEKHLKLRKT